MSADTPPTIIVIGCGKMGTALLESWLNKGPQAQFYTIDPHAAPFKDIKHFNAISDAAEPLKNADLIILAVKPQSMKEVCTELRPHLSARTSLVSIAAGIPLSSFESWLGALTPVIRVMPNTPAAISKGISVAIANPQVPNNAKTLADALLTCAGRTEWVEKEELFDAVTAVSGSGPAYVFLLIEHLAKAAQEAGLDKNLSMTLARQTVIGAAALAESESETPPAQLRQNVTSPGGTTAAALEVLMDGRWLKILKDAVLAAKNRSIELSRD